ncbi:MAG: glycine zipper domain-containing protein [Pyrinomonadaceae bacterium]
MKKTIGVLILVVALLASSVEAMAGQKVRRRSVGQTSSRQYGYSRNNDSYDYRQQDRSVWDRHRDKITTVAGALGGAAIGSAIGGKRGALIGSIAGGVGSAIYTYKIRKQDRRY